jgi:DNA-binding MarR family transcriptional regulator
MSSTADQCARELLETVPLVIRSIRLHMRASRGPELSLPQLRSLVFLGRNEGASLSELASHLGLAAASASKLIDGFVVARFVSRRASASDRRRVSLVLTASGQARLRKAQAGAQTQLAATLFSLKAEERDCVVRAMRLLKGCFAEERPASR